MNFLDEIIRHTRESVKRRKHELPLSMLAAEAEKKAESAKPNRFRKALEATPIQIIAEVKRASPSRGLICEDFHPLAIAAEYRQGGAAAVSVLTEENYFQGNLMFLRDISKTIDLPTLRKDFIVDEYQIYETAANFASAVLLIVAALGNSELKRFLETTRRLNMNALVEVHNNIELQRALDCGAEIIGINNRDLKTFRTNLRTSLELVKDIPSGKIKVSESGIKTRADVVQLQSAGFNAILVGEVLMRQQDRAAFLRELRGVACG